MKKINIQGDNYVVAKNSTPACFKQYAGVEVEVYLHHRAVMAWHPVKDRKETYNMRWVYYVYSSNKNELLDVFHSPNNSVSPSVLKSIPFENFLYLNKGVFPSFLPKICIRLPSHAKTKRVLLHTLKEQNWSCPLR